MGVSAVRSANVGIGDTRAKQAQVRYSTRRISELIRHCKLICNISEDGMAIWRADDNADGVINVNEMITLSWEAGEDMWLNEYYSATNKEIILGSITSGSGTNWIKVSYDCTSVRVIPQCSNVEVVFDEDPPETRFVGISFDLLEREDTKHYQVNATLRGLPDNVVEELEN